MYSIANYLLYTKNEIKKCSIVELVLSVIPGLTPTLAFTCNSVIKLPGPNRHYKHDDKVFNQETTVEENNTPNCPTCKRKNINPTTFCTLIVVSEQCTSL